MNIAQFGFVPKEIFVNFTKDILPSKLNRLTEKFVPEQTEIFDLPINYRVLVQAGAGSGKTTVLLSRILKFGLENDGDFSNCACFSFSNSAANEIKERLVGILGVNAKRYIRVQTFHSFALKELNLYRMDEERRRKESGRGGEPILQIKPIDSDLLEKNIFTPMIKNPTDAQEYMGLGIPREPYAARRFYDLMNYRIECTSETVNPLNKQFVQEIKNRIHRAYSNEPKRVKDRNKAMDYGSILIEFLKHCEKGRLKTCCDHMRMFFFDEFQDLSVQFLRIFLWLVNREGQKKPFLVVGDEDQKIFLFNGESIDFRSEVQKLSGVVEKTMVENHRCKNKTLYYAAQKFKGVDKLGESKIDEMIAAEGRIHLVNSECFESQAKDIQEALSDENNEGVKNWAILGTRHIDLDALSEFLKLCGVEFERWDQRNRKAHRVIVATIFAVKGCEFGGVYMVNCTRFVHPNSHRTDELKQVTKLEVQRRSRCLFYVGITRAIQVLYLGAPVDMANCPSFKLKPIKKPGISPYVDELGRFVFRSFSKEEEHKKIKESEQYPPFRMNNNMNNDKKRKRNDVESLAVEEYVGRRYKKRKLE